MIVCHCDGVTDREIRACVQNGARSPDDVADHCGASTGCGGCAALVAEIVVGELGRRLGIRVPELVIVDIDPEMARRDPDQEIQELSGCRATGRERMGEPRIMAAIWTPDDMLRISSSDEMQIAAKRIDGTLRRWLPIWNISL